MPDACPQKRSSVETRLGPERAKAPEYPFAGSRGDRRSVFRHFYLMIFARPVRELSVDRKRYPFPGSAALIRQKVGIPQPEDVVAKIRGEGSAHRVPGAVVESPAAYIRGSFGAGAGRGYHSAAPEKIKGSAALFRIEYPDVFLHRLADRGGGPDLGGGKRSGGHSVAGRLRSSQLDREEIILLEDKGELILADTEQLKDLLIGE